MGDAISDRLDDGGDGDWLRMLGQVLSEFPEVYDEFRPVAGDSAGKAFGKKAVRYGCVGTAGSLGVVVCGMAAVKCL